MTSKIIVSLCFLYITTSVVAHNILVVISLPTKSHGILGNGLVRHLLKGDHEVTFITPHPIKQHPNLTVIDIMENKDIIQGGVMDIKNMMDGRVSLQSPTVNMRICTEISRMTLSNPKVQALLADRRRKFDLVIAMWVFQDVYAGFSAVFDCPLIWFSSLQPHWVLLRLIDEIPNPSYVTDSHSSNAPPLTFVQRVQELMTQIYGTWFYYYYITPLDEQYYKDYFVPHIRKKPVPSLSELKYNASLVFGTSYVSLGDAIRLPANYIPVGGFHIQNEVEVLPEELQKVMDNAQHGVIYFSLGSSLKSEDLPETVLNGILKIFSQLNQTVIWKFQKELWKKPENVHIVSWAPQHSILAHPKTILFVSHGGFLSIIEAIHFAVPLVCIPVMVDQFVNVDRAVRGGFALKVDLSLTMENDLEKAIHNILNDSKYATKAKEVSFIHHHRPVSPGEEILHWVDHVVLTRGARHLTSPALLMPWYQKIYLDLVAVILVMLMPITLILKKFLNLVCKKNNVKKTKLQ